MITEEVLLKNGYKEFPVSEFNQFAQKFYQKRIKDDKGIKYFIDFYIYYNVKSNLYDYECDLQFETKTNYYMNINYLE
jgi:hypothetical protein